MVEAGVYEGGRELWECAIDLVEWLAAHRRPSGTVLELGCGLGLASCAAALGGATAVVATDLGFGFQKRQRMKKIDKENRAANKKVESASDSLAEAHEVWHLRQRLGPPRRCERIDPVLECSQMVVPPPVGVATENPRSRGRDLARFHALPYVAILREHLPEAGCMHGRS